MSQLRYFNAFILSSLTFILLYFSLLSLIDIKKVLKPTPSKVIKVSIVTPPKKVAIAKPIEPIEPKINKIEKVEPTIPPAPPQPKPKKVVKKVKPKEIVKKKVIKKSKKRVVKKKIVKRKITKKKKTIKKRVIKKKVVKKKAIKKPAIKETIKEFVAPVTPHPHTPKSTVVKSTPKSVPKASKPVQAQLKNDHHKKAFLRSVRSKIIANKKYPKIAKRRHIEGSVKVRFDITKSGNVSNIRFISGKRIFQKSIRKTLERTFPMSIPAKVQNQLPILDISVVLHFHIR